MAEVASAVVAATTLLLKVSSLLSGEAAFVKRVKEQIKQLEDELKWMHLDVKEADEDRKSHEKLNLFAKQMREIIFDAEDVIDDFILKIVDHKWLQKVSSDIFNMSFLNEMGKQIQNISDRVEKLKSMERNKLTVDTTEASNRDSSLLLPQLIKGRRAEIFKEIRQQEPVEMYEGSTRIVIDLLLGDESDNSKKLRVISITGMGGVGKTTLSQKVFNDEDVVEQFKYRAFVYVSKEYDLQDLLRSIMKSCGFVHSDHSELTSEKVREHLEKQKYLIVLDDIWDEKAWIVLERVFPDANNGSRVLLTTRNELVALEADKSSINNSGIHELSTLDDEKESWELFRKSYSKLTPDSLKKLGEQMVEKCHGLPLAIVVLGIILSFQEKKHFREPLHTIWTRENSCSSWLSYQGDYSCKCSGILALSYDYLPYHLKPCFLYMSLFPEATTSLFPKITEGIRAQKLFQCWIAEGFIEDKAGESLEDTAEGYLEELISRNLIQVSKRRCDGRVSTCSINGVLHGISASESLEDEFSQTYDCVDKFNCKENSHSRRRVAVGSKKQNNKYLSARFLDPRIRSLLCHEDVLYSKKKSLRSFFLGFKSLRVLEFKGYTGIFSLPKEVGELIHLRYLSLGKTKLKEIDTSHLRKLVNLQTLYLTGDIDHKLVLDDQIWCLDQLRNLYLINIQLPGAKNRRWISTVNKFGIDNLEELQLLFIQDGDWINDAGFKNLSSFRKLKIEECLSSHSDNISKLVGSLTELRSLALISKTSSERLLITHTNPSCLSVISKPFSNLSLADEPMPQAPIEFSSNGRLTSLHLKGHILKWQRVLSLPPNLCKLKLEGCSWNVKDPMLIMEKLDSLRFLHLSLESCQVKQMVCSKGGFVGLQKLELVSILSLEEWRIEEGALANLTKLKICDCKKLKMLPDGLQHLTKVEELETRMPHLGSRMAEDVGEDWHKIKDIPSRKILY